MVSQQECPNFSIVQKIYQKHKMQYKLAGELADMIMWLLHLHYVVVASKSQALRVISWSKLTYQHLSTLMPFA